MVEPDNISIIIRKFVKK